MATLASINGSPAPCAAPAGMAGLRDDQRGAVMVTGLFMAFFLVGALWFVIGIGDAIIFRDRMQEAADHAAFTAAVLDAKGMNFISACNIIMLVLVAVHVVLGMIHDLLLAACLTSGIACAPYYSARQVYTGYASYMKPVLSGIALAEKVAAYGYPWIATTKAYQTGSKYGNQGRVEDVRVLAVGASNIPELGGIGLPVGAESFDFLCSKMANQVFDMGMSEANKAVPGWVKSWFSGRFRPSWGKVVSKFRGIIAEGVKLRYCNSIGEGGKDEHLRKTYGSLRDAQDKIDAENAARAGRGESPLENIEINRTSAETSAGGWSSLIDPGFDRGWGGHGPLVVVDGAGNGSDLQQIFSLNIMPKYRDTNERRISTAGHLRDRAFSKDSPQGDIGYYAQAEFFFDCPEGWGHPDCNGPRDIANATFAIKWRARLRRFNLPNFGAILANFTLNRIFGSVGYGKIRGILTDSKIYEILTRGPLSELAVGALKDWVAKQIATMENAVRGKVTDAASTPGGPTGTYH